MWCVGGVGRRRVWIAIRKEEVRVKGLLIILSDRSKINELKSLLK